MSSLLCEQIIVTRAAQVRALAEIEKTEALVRELHGRDTQRLSESRDAVTEAIAACDRLWAFCHEHGLLLP